MGNCFNKRNKSLDDSSANLKYKVQQIADPNLKRRIKKFQGKYNNFNLQMILDGQCLQINIENSQRLTCYELIIDKQFIENEKRLKYFDQAHEVFTSIVDNFSTVVVQHGVFNYVYLTRNQGAKNISLQTKIIEIDLQKKEEMIKRKIQEQYKAQLLKRDSQIEKLQSRIQLEQRKIKQLTQKLKKVESSERNSKCQQFSERNQTVAEQNCIGNHASNSHQQYYELKDLKNGSIKLTKLTKGWNNFVNKYEIQNYGKYSVKMVKTKSNSLFIGFCTDKGFNNTRHDHLQCAYYFCNSPGSVIVAGVSKVVSVNVGGTSKIEGDISQDGNVVECIADIAKNTFIWSNNGRQFFQCFIPQQMQNKKLYLSIFMFYDNDSVQLSI